MELDMDGYIRLGRLRRAFDDWLSDEGVMGHNVFYLRFGEGYVEAHCYVDLPNSAQTAWLVIPVSAPPPREVIGALAIVSRGGAIIGRD